MTTFTSEDREAAEKVLNEDELLSELKDCAKFFEDRLYDRAAALITKLRAEIERLSNDNYKFIKAMAKKDSHIESLKQLLNDSVLRKAQDK